MTHETTRDVHLFLRHKEEKYQQLDQPIELGVVQSMTIGKPGRLKAVIADYVSKYTMAHVELPESAAVRMLDLYTRFYDQTKGEEFDGDPVIDCHSFAYATILATPFPDFKRELWYDRSIGLPVPTSRLISGSLYAVCKPTENPAVIDVPHTVMGIDSGSANLSVLGCNGYLAVTDNRLVLDLYDSEAIAPLYGNVDVSYDY